MSAPFANIVVPTDFSETSADAWRVACALARAVGAHLHLLHVCADPLREAWAVEAVGVDFSAVSAEWRHEAEGRLAAIAPTEPMSVAHITRAILTGPAHRAIVEYAEDQQADLVVMGTHGYGPVKQLLLGSVAEQVLREAHCPVLMVPHRAARAAHPAMVEVGTARVEANPAASEPCVAN